jgi:hypothetical protein
MQPSGTRPARIGARAREEDGIVKSAADRVAAAKAEVQNLDADAVEEELRSGKAVLIDLRESARAEGHA